MIEKEMFTDLSKTPAPMQSLVILVINSEQLVCGVTFLLNVCNVCSIQLCFGFYPIQKKIFINNSGDNSIMDGSLFQSNYSRMILPHRCYSKFYQREYIKYCMNGAPYSPIVLYIPDHIFHENLFSYYFAIFIITSFSPLFKILPLTILYTRQTRRWKCFNSSPAQSFFQFKRCKIQ